MRAQTRRALGIDIGRNRVSVAVVERRGDEYKLVRHSSVVIPHSSDERQVTSDDLARTLRKLRRQGRIPRMNAALGLSVSPLVLQMLDMPRQMPQNVREFVESELGQYVTLSGRTIVCDFCAAGSNRDAQRRLLSTAGEKEMIRKLVETCGAAGLRVQTVEPSILAYVRARCRTQPLRTGKQTCVGGRTVGCGTVLVVEITDHQLSACLLRRGTLDFVRTKALPAEVQAVARGPSPVARNTSHESPVMVDDWLVDEIVTMMRHADSSLVARPSSLAAGHSASDERPATSDEVGWEVDILVREAAPVTAQIAESVKYRTGVLPVVIVESEHSDPCPVSRDPGHESRGTSDEGASISGVWMTAAGLAMRTLDAKNEAWNVDLLPNDVIQVRSLVRHLVIAAMVGAVFFLGMISSLLLVNRAADAKRGHLARQRTTERLYLTPAVAEETRLVDRQMTQVQQQLREINKAMAKHSGVNWSQVLTAIAQSLPAGAVQFTRLSSQDAQHLTIIGVATSGGAVKRFVQALDRRGLFESVSLGRLESQPGSKSWVRYEMECLMKPAEQEENRAS